MAKRKEIESLDRVGWGGGTEAWFVNYKGTARRDYISIRETNEHNLYDELKVYQYLTKRKRKQND